MPASPLDSVTRRIFSKKETEKNIFDLNCQEKINNYRNKQVDACQKQHISLSGHPSIAFFSVRVKEELGISELGTMKLCFIGSSSLNI